MEGHRGNQRSARREVTCNCGKLWSGTTAYVTEGIAAHIDDHLEGGGMMFVVREVL
jgi:hypothetical protein